MFALLIFVMFFAVVGVAFIIEKVFYEGKHNE